MKIITKKVDTLTEALDMQKEITGGNFFDGFQHDLKRYAENDSYYVDTESGDIYYVYECDVKILHKMKLHSSLSSAGFNAVSLWGDEIHGAEGMTMILITGENWANTPRNRKIMSKNDMIVTTLAA